VSSLLGLDARNKGRRGFSPTRAAWQAEARPKTASEIKAAVFCVNKWLLDCVQELGRAAAVLGLVFWITDQAVIDQSAMRNFSLAMDRIPFVRGGEGVGGAKSKVSEWSGVNEDEWSGERSG
jgi:hypothetical protein